MWGQNDSPKFWQEIFNFRLLSLFFIKQNLIGSFCVRCQASVVALDRKENQQLFMKNNTRRPLDNF